MLINKKNIYICLICALILIFTSCGTKKEGEDSSDTSEPVKLVFSTFYEEGAQADAYKEIVQAFEESHSNIKVTLKASPVNYDENMEASLQNGKGPDIMGLQRNRMIEYINKGYIKDISSMIESENLKNNYYGVSIGYGKYDGKYYGIGDLPYVVDWYYNADMFKKAGINKEPKDLDELIDVCKKLKKYTKTPVMVAFKDPWAVNTFFGMITAQTTDTNEISKAFGSDNKSAFQSLYGVQEAVNILNQMVEEGIISSKLANYDYAQSIDAFVKGQAAILPMGSWATEKIEETKPESFNYKTFENPVMFTSNPHSLYSATGVQVITCNENTKHPEEAMEFMKFLFNEEAQRIFAEKNGISAYKNVNVKSENLIEQQMLNHLEMTDENSTMYIDNISNKMMEVTGNRLLQLIKGKLEQQEVWDLIVTESYVQ